MKCNTRKKFKLKAVIYDKRGAILSSGENSYVKSHPVQAKYARQIGKEHAIFLHAEIHAIIKCKNISSAYKIEISRYDSSGKPKLAQPCKMCQLAIHDAGIKIITHT
jgi:tRNA(Arg) A34 adenosine deaminase TadA